MRAALAPAKLNLSLRVFPASADGYHPLDSVVVAVDWFDQVRMAKSESDRLEVDGGEAPSDGDNLVWKAVRLLRDLTGDETPLQMELSKRIPAGAGLGGGSSDAAAAIVAAADLLGLAAPEPATLFTIGADVPFFMSGGLARMAGRGEKLDPLDERAAFAMAIVVPPLELSTPAVYRRWDTLGEPEGPPMPSRHAPPSLRGLAPFRNDLWPAALALSPELGEWRSALESTWGTTVAMTGSGSALFGFFPTRDEAEGAVRASTVPYRARRAVVPVAHGAILDPRYTSERR